VSSSPDPRTLATPTEHVVLSRGLGSLQKVRVLAESAGPPVPIAGDDAVRSPAARTRVHWEPVHRGLEDLGDVHVLVPGAPVRGESPSELLAYARPWVVLVRAERDDAGDWVRELADAKYVLAVFDGRTQYFVSPEHDDLPSAFAIGDSVAWDTLVDDVIRWRTAALGRWALATATQLSMDGNAEHELQAMRQTISWRVTAPLRKIRGRIRP
jgi:hypothetical protein